MNAANLKIPFREMGNGDFFFNEDKEECQKIWPNKYLVFDNESKEPLRVEVCDPNTFFEFNWEHHEWFQDLMKNEDENDYED
jgi:hypothetical protein